MGPGPGPPGRTMLQIINTVTGKKEPLIPLKKGSVTLYVCGMTVYDHCHLGHARSAIIFDVIRTYLEHKGFSIRYVKNYTDVDDKIIRRAQEKGLDWKTLSETYIAAYEHDMARLGVRPPTLAPKATEHIPEMLALIEELVSKDKAYAVEGDVFFKVAAFPSYGKLSHQKLDEMQSGARVKIDPKKKDPLDFVLWKKAKPGEPAWASPWGPGRPGWHIECSAMAMKHLGETIDLHGGGEDLIFPHHENEIAQSEAASGKPFVGCWIHHGFVTIDKEKMSKSLGNFFTVDEIFRKLAPLPDEVIAETLRFYLLSTHYRSPVDFSDQGLKAAKSGLDNFYTLFQKVDEAVTAPTKAKSEQAFQNFNADFEAAMDDDFNTPKAFAVLQTLRAEINSDLNRSNAVRAQSGCRLLIELGRPFGLLQVPHQAWRYAVEIDVPSGSLALDGSPPLIIAENTIQTLVAERETARREKNWARSDEIREQLAQAGVIVEDRPDGRTRIKR